MGEREIRWGGEGISFPGAVFLVALWAPGQHGLESEGGALGSLSA